MIGSRELAAALATRLHASIEGEVNRLADELGPVTPGIVAGDGFAGDGVAGPSDFDAVPRLVAGTQLDPLRVALDDWPFLCVVPRRLSSLRRSDVTSAGRVYVTRYPTEVWIYARGDGYGLTAAVRDRLTLAVRELLLRYPHVEDVGYAFEVDEGTLTEDYSPVGIDAELGATVAAASVAFEVAVSSTLSPTAADLGQLDALPVVTATLATGVPTPHPAL